MILGTAIGFIPGIVALTLAGGALLEAMRDGPPWVWIGLGGAIAGALVLWRWRARQGLAANGPQPPDPQ